MDRPDEAPPGVPGWVKVMLGVAGLVIIALVAFMALSGGDHGPGRHGGQGVPGDGDADLVSRSA